MKSEQVSEQIENYGAENVSVRELLGLVLRSQTAADAILETGSLRDAERLLTNGEISSETIPGLTRLRLNTLRAVFALGRKFQEVPLKKGDKFTCPNDVFLSYRYRYGIEEQEGFWILMLDVRNRVIKEHQVSKGSMINCAVHPTDVFRPLLREAAVGVILIHNHPSGDPEPSDEDMGLTGRLKALGESLGVKVLDHIVICENDYVSFADRGYL